MYPLQVGAQGNVSTTCFSSVINNYMGKLRRPEKHHSHTLAVYVRRLMLPETALGSPGNTWTAYEVVHSPSFPRQAGRLRETHPRPVAVRTTRQVELVMEIRREAGGTYGVCTS